MLMQENARRNAASDLGWPAVGVYLIGVALYLNLKMSEMALVYCT